MKQISSVFGRMMKRAVGVLLVASFLLSYYHVAPIQAATVINTNIGCASASANPALSASTAISAAGEKYILVGVTVHPDASVTVADTMGGSYTLINSTAANYAETYLFISPLARDMVAWTDHINVDSDSFSADACALVISGLDTNPVDGSAVGANNWSTAMSTGSVTPTTSNSLLIGVFGWSNNGNNATVGGGWTEQKQSDSLVMQSQLVTSGSYSASATISDLDRWAGVLVALKVKPAQPPTDIKLSSPFFVPGAAINTAIGTLSAVDPDLGETYTYSLVSGSGDTDNASFTIAGDQLENNAVLSAGYYHIRVDVFDGTHHFAKAFTLSSYPSITGGDSTYNDYITNVTVTVAGLNHDSDNDGGFVDYTDYSASVVPGGTYNLSSSVNIGDGTYAGVLVAWIDWNQNFSFSDAGEKYVIATNINTTGANTVNLDIIVPADAAGGNTRMRIALNANDGTTEPPNSGADVFYGEAEDYTVQVANSCVSTGSTAWDLTTTWTCGHVPDGSETATIAAGHTVPLSGNVTQNGALVLNGTINTGANVLTLGSGAAISGTGDVIGTVRRTSFSGTQTYNNVGTTINFTTAPTQMDVKLTSSAHPNANAAGGGAYMLGRYYTLTATGSVEASLCLGYADSELGTINEANLRLCRWTGSAWECPERGASSNTTTNTVCAENVTQFSDWVMGEVGPTAVNLSGLKAQSTPVSAPLPAAGWVFLLGAIGVWMVLRRGKAQ